MKRHLLGFACRLLITHVRVAFHAPRVLLCGQFYTGVKNAVRLLCYIPFAKVNR